MARYNNNSNKKGLGVLDVILIVQIMLKLFGLIDWSWDMVLWPLWLILIIAVSICIGALLCD